MMEQGQEHGREHGQERDQPEQEQQNEMSAIQSKTRGGRAIKIKKPSPHCDVHKVQMFVGCTSTEIRYFYCPVVGCRESKTQLR